MMQVGQRQLSGDDSQRAWKLGGTLGMWACSGEQADSVGQEDLSL